MSDITITHTAADGTLVEGTSKGDGTNTILKAHGFRWFRTLGVWGIAGSRDRQPNEPKIERARSALTEAGHTVTVDIDRTHRDTATVEADKADRQQARADALENKADRHRARADAAWDAEQRAAAALPPGGEPIHVGHHSEGRHRRAIDNAHRKFRHAMDADTQATTTAQRADTAARGTERRYNPRTVANRIEKLEAEQRADQRALDGHTRTLFITSDGQRAVDITPAATGERREQITAAMAQRGDELTHWHAVRAEQIATGQTGDYRRETISAGDQVRDSFGHWLPVLRANPKTVTVERPAPFGGRMIRGTIPYQDLTGHQSAATIDDAAG
ncbi:DUF3560 domain-containing protein [Gordonia soli]|uniref:DUF3560 domain-containing protein n=1 Tax=Gordonia soli NBRC 108243 TaxID=1223545 RepID=M0QLM5_9ACTN|nr:DUF3560 domain-containing protein [Gordonia soli]GAC69565.1 hypothetical protein GS4_26_00120 [Gordonia soli NBRC 108243]